MRIVDQRAGERGALRHAAGELVREGLGEFFQADQRQRVVDAPRCSLQKAARFESERGVAPHGAPRIERRILEDHDARRVGSRHLGAVDQETAAARTVEAGDQAQQGGLAAAARSEQGDEFAGLDLEGDILQHRQIVAVQDEAVIDVAHVER